ncbi:MAG: phosphoribosylglycinamide formyltransferase [Cytophagales bacterium]|nr:phosphoribosylglycinamide formyltransferase [Cytophagales bacterium]
MYKIAIFASGSGSNAQRLTEYFREKKTAEVVLILTNKPDAYVLTRAQNLEVPSRIFTRSEYYESDVIIHELKEKKVDLIVLAGFLWKVPKNLIQAFPDKIVNIHPALLPKYGGKGMYGHHVHEAVVAAKEKISGITVHYVNEHYDEGKIIRQATCELQPSETPDTLAAKIHELEYAHFPLAVEEVLLNLK